MSHCVQGDKSTRDTYFVDLEMRFVPLGPDHTCGRNSHFDVNIIYRAGHPICRKVLKKMFREVPPADWLILYLPTAQAGTRNSHAKT